MTDRHSGYVVTLASDIREDDAEAIITALGQIRGVISVTPVVADVQTAVASQRAKIKWSQKLYELADQCRIDG